MDVADPAISSDFHPTSRSDIYATYLGLDFVYGSTDSNRHVAFRRPNLVVLTLQIQPPWGGEPLGLPINMRLHRKKEASLIELAEQMINEVIQWFPKRLFRVVGDGFYATLAGKE